jgi:hypothetical protein
VNAYLYAAAMVDGALAHLDKERGLINDLNVYPVPDGDTGTNLFLTVRAVKEELDHGDAADVAGTAAAVTKGSLMGARGNSGVILSQIVRGVCSVGRNDGALDTATLKLALAEGTTAAYRAVKQPVEGTMLTVIREMAAAAERLPDDAPLAEALTAVLASGRIAVEQTPKLLAVLREAGVVDAGGYGLLVIMQGVAEAMLALQSGASTNLPVEATATGGSFAQVTADQPAELSRFRYCTSFLLTGENLPRERFEELLTPLGDSLLLVGDERMLKVHVHTDDPGTVLSCAVRFGTIGEVEINDMHAQTRERDARLAAARATGTVVVAVVAGEGNKELFRQLGCAAIVDGGQSMNPSAAQLLDAVEALRSNEVVVLPNNGNVVLTAEQAAGMSTHDIAVVPSKSIPSGMAAMVAFDPQVDAVANAKAMEEALRACHDAEITVAVRDSRVGHVEVRKDQVIGLIDGQLAASGESVAEVFRAVLGGLSRFDPEVLTVLTSQNGTTPSDAELEAAAAQALPHAEVSIHEGGQPLYPILIGAE